MVSAAETEEEEEEVDIQRERAKAVLSSERARLLARAALPQRPATVVVKTRGEHDAGQEGRAAT